MATKKKALPEISVSDCGALYQRDRTEEADCREGRNHTGYRRDNQWELCRPCPYHGCRPDSKSGTVQGL